MAQEGRESSYPASFDGRAVRLQGEGLPTVVEENTACCYAVQDKVWVHGPDAEPWEVYTVLADASVMHPAEGECCAPGEAETASVGSAPQSSCC